jgi:tetratricopeptide (TPR) repeat protein
MNCTQAIIHSQLANDWNIYIACQLRMASILSYHKQPKASLQAYQEALRRINGTGQYISPLLQGWTFAGIGTMYAALGNDTEAMQYMHLAMTTFPDEPEEDLAYPYTCGETGLLILHEGLILLKLGEPQLAWDIFTLVEDLKPAVSRRTRAEILHYKAAIALVQRHMMQCCVYLEAAIKAACDIKSVFFLSENYALYENVLACWGQESRIRILGKLFP